MPFRGEGRFAPIVLAAVLSAFPFVGSSALGQSAPVFQLPFKVFDYRGTGIQSAIFFAAGASKKAYAVLLVRGNDPAIIKNAEDALLAVYQTGRNRVVLVKADGDSKLMQVYAKGLDRYVLDKADASNKTKSATVEALVEVYDKYVVPEMKAAPKQDLDEK